MSLQRSRAPIGLIPCAGFANRLAPLPCSKELLPVGFQRARDGLLRMKVVSQFLLEHLYRGGVRTAYCVLRKGKRDIPAYYGASAAGVRLGYVVSPLPYGPPYSLDLAYPFVKGQVVATGFPDILIGPSDVYARLLHRLAKSGADAVLGLYRPRDVQFCDMTDIDADGRVRDLVLRPAASDLRWSWMTAVWSPVFTEFLHTYLSRPRIDAQLPGSGLPAELTVGHVIQAAVRSGLYIQTVPFADHDYLDIGTPQALRLTLEAAAAMREPGDEPWSRFRRQESTRRDDLSPPESGPRRD